MNCHLALVAMILKVKLNRWNAMRKYFCLYSRVSCICLVNSTFGYCHTNLGALNDDEEAVYLKLTFNQFKLIG